MRLFEAGLPAADESFSVGWLLCPLATRVPDRARELAFCLCFHPDDGLRGVDLAISVDFALRYSTRTSFEAR